MPTLYLIAGPNGAGKTTFASRFLPEESVELEFVNVDLIARGLSPFAPTAAAGAAARVALARVARLIRERKTFAWETTMSGRTIKGWVQKAKAAGYFVRLVFLWIQSLEESMDRIRRRVREGGHDVPAKDVRRRFLKTLRNFFNDFCPLADAGKLFDNSKDSLRRVAVWKDGRIVFRDRILFGAICAQGGPIISDFPGSATVPVASVGVPPTEHCVDDYKELRAFQNAQLDAIRRARQFDSEFIILRDDKVVALRPNETLDIERRGEENLKELNEIIARLQAVAAQPAT